MYLKFLNAPKGVRVNYALAKDSIGAYPKRAEREIDVVIDGNPAKMAITGSETYAVSSDAGNNGWIRRVTPEGKIEVTWLLFDAGFNPRSLKMKFERVDGKSPDANPVRAPKNPAGEAVRRSLCSATFAAKRGGLTPVKATDAGDATAEMAGDLDDVETETQDA